ncbi:MAG: AAA family ATPase [Chloroflexi bacterium]|nr:AAA family ATPase [Chloroflexota bacterium]
MRIERLEIDGFGRFHDASWAFGEGMTVLLGANEAGKTTLLNALRALLFGFGATRDGRTWYPALAGGRRGGRLVLRSRRGETWTVERHGERGGPGTLVVRAPNGNQGGQETLDRLLHGADRDLFTNIFAFGLGELQTFSSLSADGVRGRIYGAGAGLGGTSAIDLERRLRQQMDETFLPRGRERPLNQLLVRIESLRAEVADLARQPREHAEAHAEREEHRVRAISLRESVRGEREREARLARLLEARAPAAEAALLAEELDAGDPSLDALPVDAVAVVERHLAAVDEARESVSALDLERSAAHADRRNLAPETAVLEAADAIVAARDERAARAGITGRRQELAAALARHAHAVDEQLIRSGMPEEARLLALDDSIAAVEGTRVLERRLAAAREVVFEAERRVRGLSDDVGVRDLDAAAADSAGDDLGDRLAALDLLDALRLRRAVAESRAASGPPAWLPPAAAVALFAIILFAGTVAGQPLAGAALGGLIGGVAWLGLTRAMPASGPGDLAAIDAERRSLLERVGLPPDADDGTVRRRAADLAALQARASVAAEHRITLEARRRELEAAQRALSHARTSLGEAEAAWAEWLHDAGLPEGISPEVARQILAAAGVGRRAAAERDEHRRRLATLDAEDRAYAERVDDLARRLGATAPRDAAARDAFVVGAAERLEAAREAERRTRELDAAIERLGTRRETLVATLGQREEALRAALANAGCPDVESLRRREREATARRATRARHRELRATLAGMAGGADAVDALVGDALGADPAELEAALADAREQVERLEGEERDVLNLIGALDARIAGLERADELGARRQELAALEGRAAVLAREWSVRALALRLLSETRSRYERERQPDVVRAASQHFERITGGRYARVVAPPGDGDVRVETEGGQALASDELSRGTAEQLYLALRFGLIEEFARSAEPLPVVMDDILVNFDIDRASRAAAAIDDLATRHQVLYFTCHRHVAELLDPRGARTLTLD